jgi:hypothetical protein
MDMAWNDRAENRQTAEKVQIAGAQLQCICAERLSCKRPPHRQTQRTIPLIVGMFADMQSSCMATAVLCCAVPLLHVSCKHHVTHFCPG